MFSRAPTAPRTSLVLIQPESRYQAFGLTVTLVVHAASAPFAEPIEIQRSWPYFIMGSSQTWLMLVQELSAENKLEGEVDYPSLLLHYKEVDTRLNAQWRDYGRHAYLHHLNAIFGYQPVLIRSSELKTF